MRNPVSLLGQRVLHRADNAGEKSMSVCRAGRVSASVYIGLIMMCTAKEAT